MKGIDIYEGDNIQDWNKVKASGVEVVIQKATQGTSFVDSLLQYRYPRIKQTGLKLGFYHFANNTGDPEVQAKHFLDSINGLVSDTVLWLDIEAEENWSKQAAINFANTFISYVQNKGFKIGIYTGESFYSDYLAGNISDIPLWLASYGKQPSLYPSSASWQYSESGGVDGISGDVDLDYFIDNIFSTSSDFIKSVQHDLQRVSCLASGEGNATGILDTNTKSAIKQFRYVVELPSSENIDDVLVNALNAITKMPTIGSGWGNNPIPTKFIQWFIGISPKSGVFDANTVQKVKAWQVKAGIWSATGADGVIREKDWNKILK